MGSKIRAKITMDLRKFTKHFQGKETDDEKLKIKKRKILTKKKLNIEANSQV